MSFWWFGGGGGGFVFGLVGWVQYWKDWVGGLIWIDGLDR